MAMKSAAVVTTLGLFGPLMARSCDTMSPCGIPAMLFVLARICKQSIPVAYRDFLNRSGSKKRWQQRRNNWVLAFGN
jgi:hypothetical protein